MNQNELKNYIINENSNNTTFEEIKNKIAFYIILNLENEIKAKNNFRKSNEFKSACENELLNAGILNYYKEKNILFFENTPENRKKYFTFESLLNMIEKNNKIVNYCDWFIKYDAENKTVLDITTAGAILNVIYNKDFQLWFIENYKYYNNYEASEIAKNLKNIIMDAMQEIKKSYICCNCTMQDGTKQKIYFRKFNNNYYDFQAMDENNKEINTNLITEIDDKTIPILKNCINFNIDKNNYNELLNDFEIKEALFSNDLFYIYIKNTNIYFTIYKNYIGLNYRNNYKRFYIVNNKFYEFNYYKKDCLKQIDPFKDIASEKTKTLLKIAINKIMKEAF